MVFLVFGHTAEEPPLRIGPLPSFRVVGGSIQDHAGATLARHNGERWLVGGKPFYRMDCEGPVTVQPEGCSGGAPALGPFMHFSLLNVTAYASRDLFAQYREQDQAWHLHQTDATCSALLITPQQQPDAGSVESNGEQENGNSHRARRQHPAPPRSDRGGREKG